MKIKRVEVEFMAGDTIEETIQQLKNVANKHDTQAYGSFNGKEITSDMSIDDAYILITGKTKEEQEKAYQEYIDRLKQEEAEHKKNIPSLEKEWIDKAKGIIREEKIDRWNNIVPIRLGDLYRGMELRCTLKLVEMLDIDNCTLDEAKEEFYNQGHSGMSAGLMFSMMREFCIRGNEFVDYIK